MTTIFLFDCGCVKSRPKESRLYGSRWRIYLTSRQVIMRCLDCGKYVRFELSKPGIQISQPFPNKDLLEAE